MVKKQVFLLISPEREVVETRAWCLRVGRGRIMADGDGLQVSRMYRSRVIARKPFSHRNQCIFRKIPKIVQSVDEKCHCTESSLEHVRVRVRIRRRFY